MHPFANMLPSEQKPRFGVSSLGLVAVVALPFALTFPYSSLSHRDIAGGLSSPNANDTRLFIGVLLATVLIAAAPREFGPGRTSPRKVALTVLIGLLAFLAMNAASFLVRSGTALSAYGFPFVFRIREASPNFLRDSFDKVAMCADIVVALLGSMVLGIAQLRFVRQTPRLMRVGFAFSFALVLYVGVFSYWWLSSKRMSGVEKGVTVQLHQTELMYLTQPMWEPAFWFIERVCGYRYSGYIAAMEDSAFLFEK